MMISRLTPGSSPNAAQQRHHPADVAVVVGAEQDRCSGRSRAPACRGSRPRRRRSRRRCPSDRIDHAVLVVAELLGRAARPRRPPRRCCPARGAGRARGRRRRTREVVLVEPHVERGPGSRRSVCLISSNISADALARNELERARRRAGPGASGCCGHDLRGDLGDVLRRGSRPRASARAGAAASSDRLNRSIWAPWSLK